MSECIVEMTPCSHTPIFAAWHHNLSPNEISLGNKSFPFTLTAIITSAMLRTSGGALSHSNRAPMCAAPLRCYSTQPHIRRKALLQQNTYSQLRDFHFEFFDDVQMR